MRNSIFLAILFFTIPAFAVEKHCGMQALYSAAAFWGKAPDEIKTLMVPEFVTDENGSSTKQIVAAANSLGLNAKQHMLTAWELSKVRGPFIAHVRAEKELSYNHWICVLGYQDGNFLVSDYPNDNKWIPAAELLSNWDNIGIFVSPHKLPWRFELAAVIFPVGIAVALLGALCSRRKMGWLVYLLFPWAIGGLWCYGAEYGFVNNKDVCREMMAVFAKPDVPDTDKLEGTLIDARLKVDFDHGTIPGAIHVPPDAKELPDIPRDKPITIFCLSPGCPMADRLAVRLKEAGYKNIRIYRKGYLIWAKEQKEKK